MKEKAEKAIGEAAKEVLKVFKNEYVIKFAYIENPKQYSRTLEFLNAWDFSDVKAELTKVSTELFYNPDLLKTFDPDNFIHGSHYSSPPDIRDNLPAILEGKQSRLWLSVPRNVKFFEKFLKDMFDGGQLEKILTKHFLNNGFKRI